MKPKVILPLLVFALVSACAEDAPLQPAAQADGTVTAMNVGVPAETRTDMIRFSDMEVVDGARAGLLRQSDAIRTRTHTVALSEGDVLTLWWVIFNHPEECGDGTCGETDLFDGPDGPTGVEPACLYGGGSIVGGNGRARFHDELGVGESRDSCIDFFVDAVDALEGQDYGLTNPEGAEVHLVLRSHGPLIPGLLQEQRSTFAGGCEELLGPGVDELERGQCSDHQFAVFPSPGG